MDLREHETPLQQEHPGVREAHGVADGVLHRVVPEGENGAPGEDISMIPADQLLWTPGELQFLADLSRIILGRPSEHHSAIPVLQHQDKHQDHDS